MCDQFSLCLRYLLDILDECTVCLFCFVCLLVYLFVCLFFAADTVMVLKHIIVSDWERVMDFFFTS